MKKLALNLIACVKILRLVRVTVCQSTATLWVCNAVCVCMCEEGRRLKSLQVSLDCINMIDSVNGVIIQDIRQLKSFISQSGLDNQSLKNKPSFSSIHSIASPSFSSVLPLLHIKLSSFSFCLCCRMSAVIS